MNILRYIYKGFTVIELLVVLLIIATLASILVPVVTNKTTEARYAKALADIKTLEKAIYAYEADLGEFPPSGTPAGGTIPSPGPPIQGSGYLMIALERGFGISTSTPITARPAWRGPYIEFDRFGINTTQYDILDPWGQPYIYVNRNDYASWGTSSNDLSETYYNFYTFQIWSKGKNGYSPDWSTHQGGTDKDDVNNWFGRMTS